MDDMNAVAAPAAGDNTRKNVGEFLESALPLFNTTEYSTLSALVVLVAPLSVVVVGEFIRLLNCLWRLIRIYYLLSCVGGVGSLS